MEVPHPAVAGRYRLVEQIGAGGMGVVWRAEDERLRRPVAVKLLRPPVGLTEEEVELATERAMREARITAQLHHPHAVAVFDVVEHEGRPGLVMQYVPSVPLSTVLREGGPLSLEETVRLGAEVASALAAAHQLGIVHRDVKPGNILVAEDGSAMLSDFGISRVLGDATLTVTGMVHGTPAYLAPEVARGASSDASTDVYSLGSTLYAALEGSPPFGSDPNPIVVLHKVATADFPPPRRSGPLTPLLLRMLAADPAQRPTMAAVASELAALRVNLAEGGAATRPLPVPAPAPSVPPEDLDQQPPRPAETAATPLLPAAAPADQTSLRPALADPGPPAAPPGSGGPPDPEPGRGRGRVVGVVVALLVLAVALAVIFWPDGDPGTATPSPSPAGTARSGASGGSSASRSPSSEPSGSESGSASASASESASASASETESASESPSASSGSASPSASASASASSTSEDKDVVGAVTSYYGLLPGDTDAGWARLTKRYQRASGGRAGYDRFWASFRQVSTSKVSATGRRSAEATISYVYTDGRTLSERRSFSFSDDDGGFKIDASSVIG